MSMPHAADASPAPGLPATDEGFLTPFLRHAAATPERIFARLGGSVLTFGALDTSRRGSPPGCAPPVSNQVTASRSCSATARPRSP